MFSYASEKQANVTRLLVLMSAIVIINRIHPQVCK
jgi:hypothetical protein